MYMFFGIILFIRLCNEERLPKLIFLFCMRRKLTIIIENYKTDTKFCENTKRINPFLIYLYIPYNVVLIGIASRFWFFYMLLAKFEMKFF